VIPLVLPPVYSSTFPPRSSRQSFSAASIMASAMRSFMLPVGFSLSILRKMLALALALGTMAPSTISDVSPIRSRMDVWLKVVRDILKSSFSTEQKKTARTATATLTHSFSIQKVDKLNRGG